MAKRVLKRNEFEDHTNIDFVRISSVFPTHPETGEPALSEDQILKNQMLEKRQEMESRLKEEEDNMRQALEQERIALLESAQKEAQLFLESSKKQIEERERESSEKITSLLEEANREKQSVLEEAREEKEKLIEEGEAKVEELQEEAHTEGFEEGYESAYKKGEEQISHLFENIQNIADHLLSRRQEILKDSQGQLIAILLSTVRKIVYKLTDTQEDLVIKTLQQAFLRVTSQSDIIVRVNSQDFTLVEQWVPKLQEHFKNLKSIKIFEDSVVERGGCLIETDFGEIDARIATQISRLEERILEINPVLAI